MVTIVSYYKNHCLSQDHEVILIDYILDAFLFTIYF